MGSLCTLDSAVELRAARGKCEQSDATGFALLFELTGELTASIDLDRLDIERTLLFL